jgi:hypothetical protein
MRFVWFWTFWHWSKESFRSGFLLRSPLHGVGSHWDEWFRHEASRDDLQAIERIGRTESAQREFIAWLLLHWAAEANLEGNRLAPRFVLGQLAQVPPFKQWSAFEEYGAGYGLGGISAIVLAEGSAGESGDVRALEAVTLPAASETIASRVIPEGFQADRTDLETPRRAAMSLLGGKGLLTFLALWIAGGHRPYPRWLQIGLNLGWLAVSGLMLYVLLGRDPGERLPAMFAMLATLWVALVLTALGVVGTQSIYAWRTGKEWRRKLEGSQVRFHMNGGLTLKGGSAGLPFCLNTLLSLYRVRPPAARRSWLWYRFFRKLHGEADSWAATGVVTSGGYIKPVVLDPKLRACLQHTKITDILTPHQRNAGSQTLGRVADALASSHGRSAPVVPISGEMRLGFAAEKPRLRIHKCVHMAQAIMAIGGFTSVRQIVMNTVAMVVSTGMFAALPDLRSILLPPAAPAVVAPSSPSPYYLWVSLDTRHPAYFYVAFESGFWSNRRSEVKAHGGANASMRAEIRLHRVVRQTSRNEEDGTVWIERRRRFLFREFGPGERVGRYSFSYVSRLEHE